MAKPKTPQDEDPEQSGRFLDVTRELEAAGELNLTEAGEAFDRLLNKTLPAKMPPQDPEAA